MVFRFSLMMSGILLVAYSADAAKPELRVCQTTIMDLSRFVNVEPFSEAVISNVHQALHSLRTGQDQSALHRVVDHLRGEGPEPEFVTLWGSHVFGTDWEVLSTLGSEPEHRQAGVLSAIRRNTEALLELPEFGRSDLHPRRSPTLQMIGSERRPWAHFWKVYRWTREYRLNPDHQLSPSEHARLWRRVRDGTVLGIAFDSNMLISRRDYLGVEAILRAFTEEGREVIPIILPENVAETSILLNGKFRPLFLEGTPSWDAYERLMTYFREQRIQFENSVERDNGTGSSRRLRRNREDVLMGDDRLLAQTVFSGAHYFFTQDYAMLDALLLHPTRPLAQADGDFMLRGVRFFAAKVQFRISPHLPEVHFTVLSPGYQLPQARRHH